MTNRFDSSSISNLNDASFAQVLAWRASKNPNGEAARIAGQVPWTAMELWNLAARWADEMRANVARGDIIATNQEAGPQAIALTAAISALGAVEMPLSTDSIQDREDQLVTHAKYLAAITDENIRDAESINLNTVNIQRLTAPSAEQRNFEQKRQHDFPANMSVETPALIMSTSGTTGRSKAAVLPVGAPIGQAVRVSTAMKYCTDDIILSYFPWHHINARHAAVLPALLSGARVVFAPRFSASGFIDLVRQERITAFNFMGAMCMMLLAQPPNRHDRSHDLKKAYGGPAPKSMVRAFKRRYGVTLRQAYACTELGDVATTSVDELRKGAAGRVVDDYDVCVVDSSGNQLDDGKAGELLVQPRYTGKAVLEYLNDEEATEAAWSDGWFRTRDMAIISDGWLYLLGRLSDVIRRRGININPEYIEATIRNHPQVSDVAAVAVPSALTEDEILCYIVPNSEEAPPFAAIHRHCVEKLPKYAIPKFFTMTRSLPYNANLKLDRKTLRDKGMPTHAWGSTINTLTEPEVS